jgi:hypothetical protein
LTEDSLASVTFKSSVALATALLSNVAVSVVLPFLPGQSDVAPQPNAPFFCQLLPTATPTESQLFVGAMLPIHQKSDGTSRVSSCSTSSRLRFFMVVLLLRVQ